MARLRGTWYVTTPDGYRRQVATRSAARSYAKEHGGARAGYRSNEYEHRIESVKQRIALGYTEQVIGTLESAKPAERTTGTTLLANWRIAHRAGDLEAASRFQAGLEIMRQYQEGRIDRARYTEYMRELYLYASQRGYVGTKSYREWLYYGKS